MVIEFNQELQPMAGIVYWFIVINAFACLAFTLIVIVGGIFDLKFLITALKEEKADETDDGRVITYKVRSEPEDPTQTES